MADLLPCPFCGGAAEMWRALEGRPAWVACIGKCAVLVTRDHMSDEEAIAAWNRRALPAASQPEAEPVAWRSVLEQYRDHLCEGYCNEAGWSDAGHSHPDMQRDCGGCRAAAALLAHPTPAPVVPAEGLDANPEIGMFPRVHAAHQIRTNLLTGQVDPLQSYVTKEDCLDYASRISAHHPAAPVSGVTVKPLAWEANGTNGVWSGELIFGVYYSAYDEGSGWRAFRNQFLSEAGETEIAYGDKATVLAAAQADYKARILSALEG